MSVKCKHCGEAPTVRAHLIPQSFVREVRDGGKHVLLTKGMTKEFRQRQNGLFDTELLCASCDNRLGAFESFAFDLAKQLRELSQKTKGAELRVENFDSEKFLRFAAGICWKYTATRDSYGRIEVGPYAAALKDAALGSEISAQLDALIFLLRAKDRDSYLFRCPMPDRHSGINMIRFSVGMMLIFLKVDKRPVPVAQRSNWIRGKTDLMVPTLPLEHFEEGKHIANLWADNRVADRLHASKRKPRKL